MSKLHKTAKNLVFLKNSVLFMYYDIVSCSYYIFEGFFFMLGQ